MLSLPTTIITVYRGTSLDEYGDEIDTDTVHLSGLPASLIEQTRYVNQQSSATPMIVRSVVARVSAGTDIVSTDRILDENTGKVFEIVSVSSISNPLVQADMRLDLKEVG